MSKTENKHTHCHLLTIRHTCGKRSMPLAPHIHCYTPIGPTLNSRYLIGVCSKRTRYTLQYTKVLWTVYPKNSTHCSVLFDCQAVSFGRNGVAQYAYMESTGKWKRANRTDFSHENGVICERHPGAATPLQYTCSIVEHRQVRLYSYSSVHSVSVPCNAMRRRMHSGMDWRRRLLYVRVEHRAPLVERRAQKLQCPRREAHCHHEVLVCCSPAYISTEWTQCWVL